MRDVDRHLLEEGSSQVEVAGEDEGFERSWYSGEVLKAAAKVTGGSTSVSLGPSLAVGGAVVMTCE